MSPPVSTGLVSVCFWNFSASSCRPDRAADAVRSRSNDEGGDGANSSSDTDLRSRLSAGALRGRRPWFALGRACRVVGVAGAFGAAVGMEVVARSGVRTVAGRVAVFAVFVTTAGFFLGACFIVAGLRVPTWRAVLAGDALRTDALRATRLALRATRLLVRRVAFDVFEAVRFRAPGRAVGRVDRLALFFFGAAFFRTTFFFFRATPLRTPRVGRALRKRPAPRAGVVPFRAVVRAVLRLAIA